MDTIIAELNNTASMLLVVVVDGWHQRDTIDDRVTVTEPRQFVDN